MATSAKRVAVLLLALITLTGLAKCARQKSPLLVEDDGSRRNRPAGEFLCLRPKKKLTLRKQLWEMTCRKAFKRLDNGENRIEKEF
jgi:hypothetical protein